MVNIKIKTSQKSIINIVVIALIIFGFLVGVKLWIVKPKTNSPKINIQSLEHKVSAIKQYYPLQEGNYWEYKGIKKEERENGKIDTTAIQKRVEVTNVQEIDKGMLISLRDGDSPTMFVQGKTIDFEPNNTSDTKFTLTFPLYVGQKWGGTEDSLRYRNDGFYVWWVEEKLSKEVLGKTYNECFRVVFKELADTTYKVFCYGLGIVEEGYKHNGTVLGWNYKLTNYQINKSKM